MKSYKLVNCKEVQEKAFRLGCSWNTDTHEEIPYSPFLYIDDYKMMIDSSKDTKFYFNLDYTEITQDAFLALPEPIKVGDWVFIAVKGVDRKQLVKVDGYYGNSMRDTDGLEYTPSDLELTKLTKQQIKVLGLEEDF